VGVFWGSPASFGNRRGREGEREREREREREQEGEGRRERERAFVLNENKLRF